MHKKVFKQFGDWVSPTSVSLILLGITLLSMYLRYQHNPELFEQWVMPKSVHTFNTHIDFEAANQDVAISVYVPQNTDRQTVLEHAVKAPHMQQSVLSSANGMLSRWQGMSPASNIDYRSVISSSGVVFGIPENLTIDIASNAEWQHYLAESDVIPVSHPEITATWERIKPQQADQVLSSLRAIYTLVSSLPTLPFKGTTDSLTALRLGAASCNGKSRLFVSLARHIGLPSRLVGGVVLTPGRKKTSHQWVEVNVEDQWVPFDPTNKHFARLPSHYLALYWGDKALFTRSANMPFNYEFNIENTAIAPSLQPQYGQSERAALNWSFANLLTSLNISPQTSAIFLLLPLCTLLISVLRNVIGISSFGTFMPMLIASACVALGLSTGLLGFTIILCIATLSCYLVMHLKLLKIPRLAIIVTLINLVAIGLLSQFKQFTPVEIGVMSLFPIIIISFIADTLNDLIEERQWATLLKDSGGTLLSIVVCYLVMESALLQGLLAVYSELYLLILAGLIYIGSWTGLKLTEVFRFSSVISESGNVLGINARNRHWVAKHNSPQALKQATDKLATKRHLCDNAIPTPDTIAFFQRPPTIEALKNKLEGLNEFVIKPNQGSQGKGIIVIKEKGPDCYYSVGGKVWTIAAIHKHIHDIICGRFSSDKADIAYLEPRVEQNASITSLAPSGLADIRVIVLEQKILCAMLRLPTQQSDGKANLHQGAIGASLNLEDGTITRAKLKRHAISFHPDSNIDLIGFTVPHWERVIDIAEHCARTNVLGYMGIDICIDAELGPLVLEINGRPGLEIQNIQKSSLKNLASQPLQFRTA